MLVELGPLQLLLYPQKGVYCLFVDLLLLLGLHIVPPGSIGSLLLLQLHLDRQDLHHTVYDLLADVLGLNRLPVLGLVCVLVG